jgi:hypothetical protein
MKQSDIKNFRDLCSSIFVLNFEPEEKPKKKPVRSKKQRRPKKAS